ncbi:uncharacterized protein LOC123440749 [Hordeum vulgare subsp. vulgare]|uniref:F-box domain-containing protein n=1 Tax=Hordeum vulgare subsp. vulgare TaxID=112509 RepID=A0A8I6X6W0_HORVV|nr:uncharacterized protein LOC123440749 [Hordeum vulgare subsp. vulgare]
MASPPAALPEDVVLEILARVPDAAGLFRCAAACRRWRTLVADPSFLRCRWPDGARHPSSLLGFFGQECCRRPGGEDHHGDVPDSPGFVRAPGSVLGSDRAFLRSFVPGAAGILDRAVPLASHRGLLLVRLVPAVVAEPSVDVDHLAVCNLHSGACDVLPPLERGWFFDYLDASAYAVVSEGPASFKVLIVGYNNEGNHQYDLRTFSSGGEPSWSAASKLFNPMEHGIFGPLKQRGAVVRHGTVHWLMWDLADFHAIDLDAVTGRVSLQKLPAPRPRDMEYHLYDMPRLSVAADETALSSLCLFREPLRVETWTRPDGGEEGDGHCGRDRDWCRAKVVELRAPGQKQIDWPVCLCLGERSGTLLVKDRNRCMYIADLESGAMEEATDKQFCRGLDGCRAAFPVEIDWPAFFMCRLGGKSHA